MTESFQSDTSDNHANFPFPVEGDSEQVASLQESPFALSVDAEVARMRAAAGMPDPKLDRPAADAANSLPSPADPLMFTTTTFLGGSSQTKYRWPTPSVPVICDERLGVAFCGKRVRAFKVGCCRKDCWGCEECLRTRSARAIEARFTDHLKGRAVCYTVPTVPEHLREQAADLKTWRGWVKAFVDKLKERLGLVWAVERPDPAGKCADAEISGVYCDCSKCSKWHPHSNLLWVRSDGRGKLTHVELWLMKTWWAEIIGAEFVWDGDYVKPLVDVHHKFVLDPGATEDPEEKAKRKAQLWKLFRYMGRTWPAWYHAVRGFIRIRWMGKFPTKPPSEEKSEAKMRRLYRELERAKEAGEFRLSRRIQKQIDKLRNPVPCRCGCGIVRPPEPEKTCKCCGEQIEVMRVLDEEEAAYWREQGPEAAREELQRRRKAAKGRARDHEEFNRLEVKYWRRQAVGPPELFGA